MMALQVGLLCRQENVLHNDPMFHMLQLQSDKIKIKREKN